MCIDSLIMSSSSPGCQSRALPNRKTFFACLEAIVEGIATEIVSTLYRAELTGPNLDDTVKESVAEHFGYFKDLIAAVSWTFAFEFLSRAMDYDAMLYSSYY